MTYKILCIAHSKNAKTGDIVQTYTQKGSCPIRCPFHLSGCYGENYFTNMQWNRAETAGVYPHQLRDWIEENTDEGALIRHNVAGDMAIPGTNNISPLLLGKLLDAFKGRKAYSYTHCEINEDNAELLRVAQDEGFVISFSCETVEEVDKAKALGCQAVLTVEEFPQSTAITPDGHFLVPCPAQTHENMTCKKCRLCANPKRETVIMFKTHGTKAKKANQAIEKKITFHGLKVTHK